MSDRDELADLIISTEEAILDPNYVSSRSVAKEIANAIIAAGWVRCLHINRSSWRNSGGPWHHTCSDCGKRWKE